MFIHVEILDGETGPKFNPKGVNSLVGRIQESSVCAADGGRIPGCICNNHNQCMNALNGCVNGVCAVPTFPIGVYDPDGPQDLMLTVADSGNRNMQNNLAFEIARYEGGRPQDPPTFGKDSSNDHYIHPPTMTGHIDGTTAITNVDTYTIDLNGLTMITGVVLMAAPVTAPDLSSITFSDWNFVKNDDGVVVGPTPDYASCQVQCDVCNAEEDDGNPATETCTCLSWTWDKQKESCGLSKFAHTTAESSLKENTFTSGLPSGRLIGGRYKPVGAKIESFSVEYTDRNGNAATVKSFTSVSKQGVETYGATKSFVGNKWRGEEKVYPTFQLPFGPVKLELQLLHLSGLNVVSVLQRFKLLNYNYVDHQSAIAQNLMLSCKASLLLL
jgi:hypothetical protein